MSATPGTWVGRLVNSSLVRSSTALPELQKWTGWGARGDRPVCAAAALATTPLTQAESSNGFNARRPRSINSWSSKNFIAALARNVLEALDDELCSFRLD